MPTLLTAKQVEELLNIDRTTVYRMLKDGRLSGVKIGQHWRFNAADVEALLSGNQTVKTTTLPVTADVLPLHCMQPVQDVFAEIAEVGAVTTSLEGQPLTKISNSCDFCKLILGSEDGRKACIASWKKLAQQQTDSPEFIKCHAGLEYARARIDVHGTLIAILVTGQFYTGTPNPEEERARLEQLAQQYNIDLDLLILAAQKITVLEERNICQITGWLERVAQTFEQISSERVVLMDRLKQISTLTEI